MRLQAGEAYGAENLDSYSSRAESYGFFDRLENFSFWGSGDRLKVEVTVFSFVISVENTGNPKGKSAKIMVFEVPPDFESTPRASKCFFFKSAKSVIKFSSRTVGIQVF